VADGGADVARDALRLLGEDPETRESRVDVHERGERASEPAPHAAREPEIETDADDPGQEDVHDPVVVGLNPATDHPERRPSKSFPAKRPAALSGESHDRKRAPSIRSASARIA
jgi:hypothetical protein